MAANFDQRASFCGRLSLTTGYEIMNDNGCIGAPNGAIEGTTRNERHDMIFDPTMDSREIAKMIITHASLVSRPREVAGLILGARKG